VGEEVLLLGLVAGDDVRRVQRDEGSSPETVSGGRRRMMRKTAEYQWGGLSGRPGSVKLDFAQAARRFGGR